MRCFLTLRNLCRWPCFKFHQRIQHDSFLLHTNEFLLLSLISSLINVFHLIIYLFYFSREFQEHSKTLTLYLTNWTFYLLYQAFQFSLHKVATLCTSSVLLPKENAFSVTSNIYIISTIKMP